MRARTNQQARDLSAQVEELYREGRCEEAIPLAQRALEICTKVHRVDHSEVARSLNDLAALYYETGSYAKAKPLYQRALDICKKVHRSDHPEVARSLNNLAELYRATGDYANAESLYRSALAIFKKRFGRYDPKTATALNNLALLYQDTGAYTKAELLLHGALDICEMTCGPLHRDTAGSLNNLGLLYMKTGDYAKAELLLQEALTIREKILRPEHPDTATSLNSIGGLYLKTGDYAKAEPLLQRALAIRENVLGTEHPRTANILISLGGLYLETGDYAKTEPLFQKALTIRENVLGPEHWDTARALSNLAELYHVTGAYAKVETFATRAQIIEESNVARFLLSGSEARKYAYLQKRVGNVYANVSYSLSHPSARSIALGLTSVLQYKGRVLDAVSDSVVRLRRSMAPEDQALYDQLTAVAQDFSTLTFRGPGKLSPEAYRYRLDALVQKQDRLQTELSSRSAALREAVAPIALEGVQQALPMDSVLVEFFRYFPFEPKAKEKARWGAPRYVAYLLKHTGEPAAIDLGAAESIEDLIPAFRTALSDPASDYFKDAAETLFEKLIKPLRPHLAQSERLLLSPDGALNLAPFAALVDEHGEYLLQHFELTYLTSGRDLLRMATESPFRKSAVVLAAPNYGEPPSGGPPVESGLEPKRSVDLDRSGLVFEPLSGAAAEAAALQSLLHLDAQHVLTGDHATEAKLRELHGPRILHMATHGFFLNDLQVKAALRRFGLGIEGEPLPLGENPLLRSGLALTGANARHSGETDDGILTAAEAAQLDLLGTQLVVLSACETGMGTVQTGEGVYGLRRALVLAGVQTQVVSLWRVNDAAAQELMVDYYQRLLKGEGRSGALRAAQQAMIANPARQHPCYWAAFIPIGDWTPLPNA